MTMLTFSRLALVVLAWLAACGQAAISQDPPPEPRLVGVRKIWDAAPHNAFTDLTYFGDRWWCVFREGEAHVSPDGALRVLASPDGRTWESAALLKHDKADLRDAKITITPDGRLMLSGAAALHPPSNANHQSLVWFSDDGREWSSPIEVGQPDLWLWRVTWIGDAAYGFGYATSEGPQLIRLFRSKDGRQFDVLVSNAFDQGYPNETSIVADPEGIAWCLLRRDGSPGTALLGKAAPPYDQWQWRDLGVQIGGPHMLRLPDGRWIAAVRLYDGGARTSLCWLDPATPSLRECLRLPSSGDCSYAGLVYRDDKLWISYYSSHEGKSAIYFAEVEL